MIADYSEAYSTRWGIKQKHSLVIIMFQRHNKLPHIKTYGR